MLSAQKMATNKLIAEDLGEDKNYMDLDTIKHCVPSFTGILSNFDDDVHLQR